MSMPTKDIRQTVEPIEPGEKEAVFYAWVDAGTQSQPSSVRIRISGGTRLRDPESGRVFVDAYKEVQFNMGILRTRDPEVIAVLRKISADGAEITEDKEKYLSFVEPSERRGERLAKKSSALTAELERKDDEVTRKDAEIGRLRSLLKKRGVEAA